MDAEPRLDILLTAISIIFGAVGSIAGAIALIYVKKANDVRSVELQARKIEYQQQKLEHTEHDSLFSEYRLIVDSSRSMHTFLREELKNLKKDIDDLYNDRRNCRKENEDLRVRIAQLEDELRLVKRKLAEPNSLSLFSPSTQENA